MLKSLRKFDSGPIVLAATVMSKHVILSISEWYRSNTHCN